MHQRLWLRLVLMVVGGMILLTIVSEVILFVGLIVVRNHAIDNASRILEEQVTNEMRGHTMHYAVDTGETIHRIEELSGELANITANLLEQPASYSTPDLIAASNGIRAYYGQTTVLMAETVNITDALQDMAATTTLDSVLPLVNEITQEIHRVSYLSSGGMLRTYPQFDAESLEQGWDPFALPEYVQYLTATGDPAPPSESSKWDLQISLDGTVPVLVRMAPVFQEKEFQGLLIVEIDVTRLIPFQDLLSDMVPVWLQDEQGQLLSASSAGKVFYQSIQSVTLPVPETYEGPDGQTSFLYNITEVEQPFILIEVPVWDTKWALFLATPLDRFHQSAGKLAPGIGSRSNLALLISMLVTLCMTGLAAFLVYGVIRTQFSTPIESLIKATNAVASGDLRPIPVQKEDELGKLTHSFNAMTQALMAAKSEEEQQTVNLTKAVKELEQSLRTQKEIWKTLQRVSTPIIPVLNGTLVMPLIGNLDRSRLERITEMVLKRIEQESARLLLVDVTGVAAMDEHGSEELIHMAQAVRLLGCQVMLVGVSSTLAETLVGIGANLEGIKTRTTLQSAMEEIIQRLR